MKLPLLSSRLILFPALKILRRKRRKQQALQLSRLVSVDLSSCFYVQIRV